MHPELVPKPRHSFVAHYLETFDQSDFAKRFRNQRFVGSLVYGPLGRWLDAHLKSLFLILLLGTILLGMLFLLNVRRIIILERETVYLDPSIPIVQQTPLDPRTLFLTTLGYSVDELNKTQPEDTGHFPMHYELSGYLLVYDEQREVLKVYEAKTGKTFEFYVSDETPWYHDGARFTWNGDLPPHTPIRVLTTATNVFPTPSTLTPILDTVELQSRTQTKTLLDVPTY